MSEKHRTEPKPIEDKGLVASGHMWTVKETEPYKLYTPPPVVGWWVLPGSSSYSAFKIACYTKPRWFTIKMMKYILDFTWKDTK
jgi:hypothetical protein